MVIVKCSIFFANAALERPSVVMDETDSRKCLTQELADTKGALQTFVMISWYIFTICSLFIIR